MHFSLTSGFRAGYPTVTGQVLNGEQLWQLIEGLEANELLHYTHLLTGVLNTTLRSCLHPLKFIDIGS